MKIQGEFIAINLELEVTPTFDGLARRILIAQFFDNVTGVTFEFKHENPPEELTTFLIEAINQKSILQEIEF